jgi:hypothetical protein
MSRQDMGDFDLNEKLRVLREATRALEAPQRVEEALREAYRARRSMPRRHPARLWPHWALAAAVGMVVGAGLLALLYRPRTQPAPVATVPSPAVKADVASLPAPPAPPLVAARAARPAEVAGDFVSLVPDVAWGPGESGQIMRVSMPRAALQSFGLPVDESRAFEMVRADIIVGQDMVARAIRVVR